MASELSRTFDADLRIEGESVAFFGRWEPTSDDTVLFSDFETWARRLGARRVYGPIESSTLGLYRLQISDFDSTETFPGEPRNPAVLPERLRALGYEIAQTYVTSWTSRVSEIRAWAQTAARGPLGQFSSEFVVREITPEYWADRQEDLRVAVNDIFAENFAFTPIDESTFEAAFGDGFLSVICSRTSFVVEHASGEVAGLCICFPGAGSRTLYVKTVGIVSRFRGKGVSLVAMILEMFGRASQTREGAVSNGLAMRAAYDRVGLCLMREGNFPNLLLKPLIEHERRYALFVKKLPEN